MADHLRHAAATGDSYEVHELAAGDPPVRLGVRFRSPDYAAAVDFAFDFLQSRDPLREGEVGALEIVQTNGRGRETVWRYAHGDTAYTRHDLVGRWGFDIARGWRTPLYTRPQRRLREKR